MTSLIIEEANSILPMSQQQSMFELKHKEQIRLLNCKRNKANYYDVIYKCLIFMIHNPTPLSKHRISNNKPIIDMLITNKFIQETSITVTEYSKLDNAKYYIISAKGIEYVKRYELLREMFN